MKIRYNALNIRLLKTRFDLTNIKIGKIIHKSINTITAKVSGRIPLTADEIVLLVNAVNKIIAKRHNKNDKFITPNEFFDVIDS